MTVAQAIVEFLSNYDGLVIDTNHIKEGSDKYGLFKSPNRDVKNFLDWSYEVTEYYQFLARRDSVSDTERKEAEEWLEDLTYWADDFPFTESYPQLDGGRTITGIEVTGIPYPMETTDHDTLYQMSLSITYTREREEI